MSNVDLRKLKRQDLLELLIMQSKDVIKLQTDNEVKGKSIEELEETYARLREKLNEKDAQIDRLKERLDRKDARIAELENKLATSAVADAQDEGSELVMDRIYEAAQGAVRDYMKQREISEAEE